MPKQFREDIAFKTLIAGSLSPLLIIGAVWLGWIGGEQAISAQASKSWPETSWSITYSEFEYFGSGSDRQRRPVVRYKYEVDDSEYTSERIAFGPVPSDKSGEAVLTSSRTDQIKAFATLKEGSPVPVYYDAEKPSEAVLLQGGGAFVLLYLFGAVLMAGMGVVCFLIATGRVKT